MPFKATAPHPVGLAGGCSLAPGDIADVDVMDPHNAALIVDGQLTEVQGAAPAKKTTKPVLEEH